MTCPTAVSQVPVIGVKEDIKPPARLQLFADLMVRITNNRERKAPSGFCFLCEGMGL
jgi:hypothetical protein